MNADDIVQCTLFAKHPERSEYKLNDPFECVAKDGCMSGNNKKTHSHTYTEILIFIKMYKLFKSIF